MNHGLSSTEHFLEQSRRALLIYLGVLMGPIGFVVSLIFWFVALWPYFILNLFCMAVGVSLYTGYHCSPMGGNQVSHWMIWAGSVVYNGLPLGVFGYALYLYFSQGSAFRWDIDGTVEFIIWTFPFFHYGAMTVFSAACFWYEFDRFRQRHH
jgi:hypothetical protein